VSNRRRPRPMPPPELIRFAEAYECLECAGADCEVVHLGGTAWSLIVRHNDDCPAMAGRVSQTGAAVAAARDAQTPILYLQADRS
jgi:hypothetical protein